MRVKFIATSNATKAGTAGWILSVALHLAVVIAYNIDASSAQRAGPIEEPLPQGLTFLVPPSASPEEPIASLGYQEPSGAKGEPSGTADLEGLAELARRRGQMDSLAAADAAEAARLLAAAAAAANQPSLPADVFMEIEVDSAAVRHPDSAAPAYPPELMLLGIEGHVAVRFVVDTNGRIDLSTAEVIEATRPEFGAAVREALPGMRFRPARRGENTVRQLAEQLFRFRIQTVPPSTEPATPPTKPPSKLPTRRPS